MPVKKKPISPQIAAMNAARMAKQAAAREAKRPEMEARKAAREKEIAEWQAQRAAQAAGPAQPAPTAQDEVAESYGRDYGDASAPLEQRRVGTRPNDRARSAVERAEARLSAARHPTQRQMPGMDIPYNADEELQQYYSDGSGDQEIEEYEQPSYPRMAPVGRSESGGRGMERMPIRRNEFGRIMVLNRQNRMVSRTNWGHGSDKFDVPLHWIPEGWTYQWLAVDIYGKPMNNNGMFANGWEQVPARRHDGAFMERGHQGPIVLEGMMLVERRVELTMEARGEELAAAKGLLRTQNEQFQPRMPGARAHDQTRLRVRRTLERMPGDIGRPELRVDDGTEVY